MPNLARLCLLLLAGSLSAGVARAQPVAVGQPADSVATPAEALAEDAAQYAVQYRVTLNEAVRRLRFQEASVASTDALRLAHQGRFVGIAIEHLPAFRIVVALAGADPVADQEIAVADMRVPVSFRVGARATREQIIDAIVRHQGDLRSAVSFPPGLGVDPRSGVLVVLLPQRDVERAGPAELAASLAGIAGVPVAIRTWADTSHDLALEGGGLLVGSDGNGRRQRCTTGFVVTDGVRTGLATAAHCPDLLEEVGRAGERTSLEMIGAWGARYQDVQIHVADAPMLPLFRAGPPGSVARPLATWRNRESTRAGDFVCHRGQSSGYSCAEVSFVDFAPPGDLCAGLCPPTWIAVAASSCHRGDSGGPVFMGTTAFGLLKGASFAADGRCNVYYYMSTDYLPPGWTLLHSASPSVLPAATPPR